MKFSPTCLPVLVLCAVVGACAARSTPPASTTPKYPDFPFPEIPASLAVTAEVREQHALAWRRLQAGDLRGAARDFAVAVKLAPGFFPGETGLGFVALAGGENRKASDWFRAAVGRNAEYLPGWRGLVEAAIGLEEFGQAASALERAMAVAPGVETDRTRLEVLRFREAQQLIEVGRGAREAGRLNEAGTALTQALAISPTSVVILRELALVEVAQGRGEVAEQHARRAVEIGPADAQAHAALGAVLEAAGRLSDAAGAYARAAAIDPSLRSRADAVRALANSRGVPPELAGIGSATSVTRAEVAALVGTRLADVLAHGPQRMPPVVTDIQSHWAAPWIVAVTQSGVMDVFSNHTFQPASAVRRGDLAQLSAALVGLALSSRPDQLARWQEVRPIIPDLPASNLFYRPAALSLAAGAMRADASGQFLANQPASGADVLAAISRIEQLAGR